jgi:ABC-type Na+ efflux pump permease subunit
MTRVRVVILREWLELARQPVMLGAITALFVLLATVVLGALFLLDWAFGQPSAGDELLTWFDALGISVTSGAQFSGTVWRINQFLMCSQTLGISAVLAGHTVLHDRQCHTLPFMLLAPLRRSELLLGKVVGAMGIPTLLFWGVSLIETLGFSQVSLLQESGCGAGSLAWWLAVVVGVPMWTAAICGLCALASALVRDVRTAQQIVWFLLFFATLFCGTGLTSCVDQGVWAVIWFSVLGGIAFFATVWVGGVLLGRDLVV